MFAAWSFVALHYGMIEPLVASSSTTLEGAVAKLGGEQRRLSFSFPDGHCGPAFSGSLEDTVDDHRVRVRLPVGKHRALPFPQ